MSYFLWGCRGILTLITLRSERVNALNAAQRAKLQFIFLTQKCLNSLYCVRLQLDHNASRACICNDLRRLTWYVLWRRLEAELENSRREHEEIQAERSSLEASIREHTVREPESSNGGHIWRKCKVVGHLCRHHHATINQSSSSSSLSSSPPLSSSSSSSLSSLSSSSLSSSSSSLSSASSSLSSASSSLSSALSSLSSSSSSLSSSSSSLSSSS